MNNIHNPRGDDLPEAKAGTPEQRLEQKCEAWGKGLDRQVDAWTKMIPPPVNALLDAICLTALLAGATLILKKLHWINDLPSGLLWGGIFGGLFGISLLCRLLIKTNRRGPKNT